MIVQPHIAAQGFFEALCRIAACGRQHLAIPSVEALDHAMGLRMTGLDEAVFDMVLLVGAVATMTSGRIAFAGGTAAIGKFLAVIGQDFLHREGRFSNESSAPNFGVKDSALFQSTPGQLAGRF